ncbi:MAG: hypothetical protein ACTII7_02345 [Galactobacter sp.]
MHRSLRTLSVATGTAALALSLALTGCGSDSPKPVGGEQKQSVPKEGPSAKDAVDKAKANMTNWTSVSLSGEFKDEGNGMVLEASGSVKEGEDFQLKISGTIDGKEQSADILSVGGKFYMKGSEDFYKQNMGDSSGEMAKAIGDKYLEVPSAQADAMDEMSLHGFMEEVLDPDDMDVDDLPNPDAKGKLVDFEGIQAYEYRVSDDGDDVTLYITADGSEQLAALKSNEEGQFVFKDHNKDFSFDAPSKDEVMSMEDLQKAALGG